MAYHVDVIGNEPMTGKQTLLGRVHVDDGDLRLEAADKNQEHKLLDTLCNAVRDIDPQEDAAAFVAALPDRVDYTYMIASHPHGDDECAFDQIGGEPVRDQHGVRV